MKAWDFIPLLKSGNEVYFLPTVDYDEYIPGMVYGVNLVDNTVLIVPFDEYGNLDLLHTIWIPGDYTTFRGNFIKEGVRLIKPVS
jgi:hypothetical protein